MIKPDPLDFERARELVLQVQKSGQTMPIWRYWNGTLGKRLITPDSSYSDKNRSFVYKINRISHFEFRFTSRTNGQVFLFESYWFAVAWGLRNNRNLGVILGQRV